LLRRARAEVEHALAGRDAQSLDELSREEAGGLLGGQLGALLDARCETVTTLAGELAEATRKHGVRLELLDASGAIKGYADGRPTGDPAPAIAWRHGVDVAACARAGVAAGAIAYAADAARVALDLGAYRALAPTSPLVVALRPVLPDCDSAANLAAKLRAAGEAGADRIDIYHYGLAPLSALDRVREALELAG
jgi:hypothetical protein